MLNIPELLKCIHELNEEIENEIDNLSAITNLSVETDGKDICLKFGGSIFWMSKEDELNSKEDIKKMLLEELLSLKTQIDGMINLYKKV